MDEVNFNKHTKNHNHHYNIAVDVYLLRSHTHWVKRGKERHPSETTKVRGENDLFQGLQKCWSKASLGGGPIARQPRVHFIAAGATWEKDKQFKKKKKIQNNLFILWKPKF